MVKGNPSDGRPDNNCSNHNRNNNNNGANSCFSYTYDDQHVTWNMSKAAGACVVLQSWFGSHADELTRARCVPVNWA